VPRTTPLYIFTAGTHQIILLIGATTKTQDQVQGGLLLDVVIRKGPSILQLLAGEDETLLVRGDAFLVLDLGLDALDCIGALDLQGYGLASECLHEDLHKRISIKKGD
jgi:hypothetical protein